MIKSFFIVLFIFCSLLSFPQVSVQKTESDYTLRMDSDSIIRHLVFWKDKDSSYYKGCKYSCTKFMISKTELELKDEIKYLDELWKIAADSININISAFFIGYPQEYSDIFLNQIEAFQKSEKWQQHLIEKGKTLDYKLIHDIMMEYNVYGPLNDFLKTHNYQIAGFSTEKHGFATKESLKKAGFTGKEIIPLPFMVWINLECIQEY